MSHIPAFQDELAALEKIMQDNPEMKISVIISDFDPRDVPEGYEQHNGQNLVWFDKQICKSQIDLTIGDGWITKSEVSSLKPL